jgi:hypothetical protein
MKHRDKYTCAQEGDDLQGISMLSGEDCAYGILNIDSYPLFAPVTLIGHTTQQKQTRQRSKRQPRPGISSAALYRNNLQTSFLFV